MRFGVVIVTFNPDNEVLNRIIKMESIFKDVSIVVVDNTPKRTMIFENVNDRIKFIYNENEGGIAGAINIGAEFLSSSLCDFIFTFDQDSNIPDDYFQKMNSFILKENAQVVCPTFIDRNSNTKSVFFELRKWSYKIVDDKIKTSTAITSGMGVSLNVWNTIGGMREDYIIDHVDTYFCLELCKKKIPIYINRDICLDHAIGERTKHKILGVTFKPNHHSSTRKYYIVRNGMHSSIKFISIYPSYFYLNILRIIHEFVCVVFFEKEKKEKLKLMSIALWHGVFGRLGKVK